ncbi:MAG: type II toxin-antitoxin system HicB family antitoxin [Candidatus Lambdaproteobacteria bacterium]|nr:type II toxin-antitoxin system HicB family antitoxin [Candidatus Lambdaproteobacteria bacterium]
MEYLAIVEPAQDERGRYYGAYFPDLPGCTTMGSTLRELRGNAEEAVSLYLDALAETGQPVPEPRSRSLLVSGDRQPTGRRTERRPSAKHRPA